MDPQGLFCALLQWLHFSAPEVAAWCLHLGSAGQEELSLFSGEVDT